MKSIWNLGRNLWNMIRCWRPMLTTNGKILPNRLPHQLKQERSKKNLYRTYYRKVWSTSPFEFVAKWIHCKNWSKTKNNSKGWLYKNRREEKESRRFWFKIYPRQTDIYLWRMSSRLERRHQTGLKRRFWLQPCTGSKAANSSVFILRCLSSAFTLHPWCPRPLYNWLLLLS